MKTPSIGFTSTPRPMSFQGKKPDNLAFGLIKDIKDYAAAKEKSGDAVTFSSLKEIQDFEGSKEAKGTEEALEVLDNVYLENKDKKVTGKQILEAIYETRDNPYNALYIENLLSDDQDKKKIDDALNDLKSVDLIKETRKGEFVGPETIDNGFPVVELTPEGKKTLGINPEPEKKKFKLF